MEIPEQILWLAFAVVMTVQPSSAQELAGNIGREIVQRIFSSVTLIICQDSHAQPVSLGSGFVVADETVATNLHVVEGASAGFVRLIGAPRKYAVSGIIGTDRAHDLALLSVPGVHVRSVPLGDSKLTSVGDEVFAIGNPEGLEGTISQGIVSGIRGAGTDILLQITAPISPGSSGGPVVNLRGEVIGLAVATLKVGQNLNFAVPSVYLSQLLDHRTGPQSFPAKEHSQGKTRKGGDLGQPSVSGVTAQGFLWNEDIGSQNDCNVEGKCFFSFTLRNNLQSPVSNTKYVAVFYDSAGAPVDAREDESSEEIRPGLAVRVATVGPVDASVRRLTRRVEIRVLDFQLVKQATQAPAPEPERAPEAPKVQDVTAYTCRELPYIDAEYIGDSLSEGEEFRGIRVSDPEVYEAGGVGAVGVWEVHLKVRNEIVVTHACISRVELDFQFADQFGETWHEYAKIPVDLKEDNAVGVYTTNIHSSPPIVQKITLKKVYGIHMPYTYQPR
jgi:hypothetical protein